MLLAPIPSSGLVCNARSLARFYAMLANEGELDGVRLLSAERIRLAAELQTDEFDEIWKVRVKRSLGFRLGADTGPGAGPHAMGHVGAAMYGYADPEHRLSIAFLKSFHDPAAGWNVAATVYASIEGSVKAHVVPSHLS
jgi:CubicO group peptidase (beta-lactamase class C family)